MSAGRAGLREHARPPLALALLLSAVFAFTGLAGPPLRAADEPRVAGIAWEMAHTGDVLVPHLGGEPFLEHPPLYYAALAATIRTFGSSVGMARVPGALAALATLLLCFDLARRMAGSAAGLYAIAVLASSTGFFRYSHKVMVDAWLAAAVMLGFWAYARAACEGGEDADPPARLVLLLYGAALLAFAVKGPVGMIVLGGVVGIHALCARRWRFLSSRAHVPGLLLLLVLGAAWPVALRVVAGREIFDAFFWNNFVYRILPIGDGYRGGHAEAPWFYLANLPGVVGVWLVFLPALAAWVRRGGVPEGWNARMIGFTAAAFPLGLCLLSVPATKRTLYLLPVLPPLAAALGAWIASTGLAREPAPVERVSIRVCAVLVAPLAALCRRLGTAGDRLARSAGAVGLFAAVAFAAVVVANLALRGRFDEGRDLGTMAPAIAALAGPERPLVAYEVDEAMRGALPFYAGVVLPNLRGPDALRAFLRANPRARILQGDGPLPGFEAEFPELRELQRWPTAEGVYRVYELAGSGAADESARAGDGA